MRWADMVDVEAVAGAGAGAPNSEAGGSHLTAPAPRAVPVAAAAGDALAAWHAPAGSKGRAKKMRKLRAAAARLLQGWWRRRKVRELLCERALLKMQLLYQACAEHDPGSPHTLQLAVVLAARLRASA